MKVSVEKDEGTDAIMDLDDWQRKSLFTAVYLDSAGCPVISGPVVESPNGSIIKTPILLVEGGAVGGDLITYPLTKLPKGSRVVLEVK